MKGKLRDIEIALYRIQQRAYKPMHRRFLQHWMLFEPGEDRCSSIAGGWLYERFARAALRSGGGVSGYSYLLNIVDLIVLQEHYLQDVRLDNLYVCPCQLGIQIIELYA